MTGLEKIRDRILEEANAKADEKIKAAEEEAGGIKSEAVREADKITSDAKAKAEKDVAAYKEKVDSSIEFDRRTRLLAAKQEIIGDVITEAKRRILDMSDRDYFNLMLRIMDNNIKPGKGVIYMSDKDFARLPSGFSADIDKVAADNKAELEISDETRDIGPGFVLSYGGIEENCTIDALFAEKKDELTDLVKGILFS